MASDADSIVTSESGNDDSSHDSIINDIDALVIDDKKSSTGKYNIYVWSAVCSKVF